MKRLLLLGVAVLIAATSFGREPAKKMTISEHAKAKAESFKKYVTVTDAQIAKLEQIYLTYFKANSELNKANNDAKRNALQAETAKKVKGVLGAENYKVYETKQAQFMKERNAALDARAKRMQEAHKANGNTVNAEKGCANGGACTGCTNHGK